MQVAFLHPAGTTQHEVQVPESSTQFPTHDAFPRPVAPLARGDETALGPALPDEAVPPPPRASWRTSTDTATCQPCSRQRAMPRSGSGCYLEDRDAASTGADVEQSGRGQSTDAAVGRGSEQVRVSAFVVGLDAQAAVCPGGVAGLGDRDAFLDDVRIVHCMRQCLLPVLVAGLPAAHDALAAIVVIGLEDEAFAVRAAKADRSISSPR